MSVDACQMEILFSLCVVVFSLIVMIILWPYSCWLCHHYQRSLFFFFLSMVIQIEVYQSFVCIVHVDSLHYSNENHVELAFPISLSM